MKSTAVEWANETTFHGVKDFLNASSSVKVFFGLIIVCFAAISTYQSVQIFQQFIQRPHFVTEVRYADDRDAPVFPFIKVCNLNAINRTKAKEHGLSDDVITAVMLSLEDDHRFGIKDYLEMTEDATELDRVHNAWVEFYNNNNSLPNNILDLYRELGHQCEGTFTLGCYAEPEVSPFDCCDHSEPVMDADFGLCWLITVPQVNKPNQIYRQSRPGIDYGPQISIQPGSQHNNKDIVLGNAYQSGVVVGVTFKKYSHVWDQKFHILPGKEAQIGMRLTETTMPSSGFPVIFAPNCQEKAKLFRTKGRYDKITCEQECWDQRIMEQLAINCYSPANLKLKDAKFCNLTDLLYSKLSSPETSASILNNDQTMFECRKICRPECDATENSLEYSFNTETSPSPDRVDAVQNYIVARSTQSEADVKTLTNYLETINLRVFYTSTQIQIVKFKEKYALENLLSSIGGTFSLWLGASLLTFVQLVYYLIIGFKRRCEETG